MKPSKLINFLLMIAWFIVSIADINRASTGVPIAECIDWSHIIVRDIVIFVCMLTDFTESK